MTIQSKNLHYAFNVEYFTEALTCGGTEAKPLNDAILWIANREEQAHILQSGRAAVAALKDLPDMKQMSFRVGYPGLMMGTGYPHEAVTPAGDALTGDIQMGFTFDYVTGAPYYPGSSVKGVLRSLFRCAFPPEGSRVSGEMCDGCREYLRDLLTGLTESRRAEVGEITDSDLETVLLWSFEGVKQKATKDVEEQRLPMGERDIFYDAYIVGFAKENQRDLMGLDNLTPHIDPQTGDNDPTREPKPLTMLRVMPETVITFSMRLRDVQRADGTLLLSADEKKALFRTILEDLGIGAKTHVGYGSLTAYEKTIHEPGHGGNPQGGARPNAAAQASQQHEAPPEQPQETVPRGEAPACRQCGRPAAWDDGRKAWGQYCADCLEIIRRNRDNMTPEEKEAEKQRKKEEAKRKKAEKRKQNKS
ncbi:MAG: type III-B CRISPR module RAMP protein Cmr6 [Fretibacterium sp.]|nr:type III-B CRISPR module RAMP protein Cmr6 [Fretibacterium sp.]